MEYSLCTRDIERNGVLAACRELGITVVAYSPVGRGILTGKFKSAADLADTVTLQVSYHAHFPSPLQLSGLAKIEPAIPGA